MESITFAARVNKKEFGSYVTLVLFISDTFFMKCVIPDWKRNTKRFKIVYGTGHSGS